MPRFPLYALATVLIAPTLNTHASDSLSAHVHGQAELMLALDDNRIEVLLTSPQYNLVGFEHEPANKQQRQALTDAVAWLQHTPLVNTLDGRCSLASAVVEQHSGNEHGEHGEDGHEEHDEHDHEAHAHGNHDHDDHGSEGGRHTDIEVTQTLNCRGAIDTLTTPLPTRFDKVEALDVQWVGNRGQGATRLGAGQSTVRLPR